MSERLAIKILLGLGIAILSIWLVREISEVLSRFSTVLALFFSAWLVSFVLSPPTEALVRVGARRPLAVFFVYTVAGAGLILASALVGPFVVYQLATLLEMVNSYTGQTPAVLTWAEQQARALGATDADVANFYRGAIDQARAVTGVILQNALGWLAGAASLLVNIAFSLIISIWIMLDGQRIVDGTLALVPRRYRDEAHAIIDSINDSFGGYIRGQLILAAIYAVGVAAVMWATGLEYKVICAIFAGIAMMIPFVGPFISLVPPIAIAFLTHPGQIWWIVILLIIMQQVVLNGVAPRVFGHTVNMHPLLVIAAALAGASVAGVWGALFGIPVAGILASAVKRVYTIVRQHEAGEAAMPAAAPVAPTSDAGPAPAPPDAAAAGPTDRPLPGPRAPAA